MATIHIVGAGLAGLSAAVELARAGAGTRLCIYEAANHAGGRCRSFHDATLQCEIDNGNHLILGANSAIFAYLDAIGTRAGLIGPSEAVFPFVDLQSGTAWRLRPNAGRVPWWILDRRRRVPGSRPADYLAALRLLAAGPGAAVSDCLDPDSLVFHRLWEPLTVAALNAAPREASARLMARVVRDTFGAGGAACRPYIAAAGLSPVLVEPALSLLQRQGATIHFGARLRSIVGGPGAFVGALGFAAGTVPVADADDVILALPPRGFAKVLPDVAVPEGSRAILNVHYRLDGPLAAPDDAQVIGLIGATAHWIFLRRRILSVTVSAADALMDDPETRILPHIWQEVASALAILGIARLEVAPPPGRVVKEKRATFLQTPANMARRPGPRTGFANLFLAGDWTDTGLPATIESAVRSGAAAARAALAERRAIVHKEPVSGSSRTLNSFSVS